jgi:hypothetical protein
MRGVWVERIWLAAAGAVTLGILAFYATRLFMPLPIFASDEAAYLIRALYPNGVVAALNPSVAPAENGVHLSVIRALYELGAPVIVSDRLADAAAYLGGLLLVWRAWAAKGPAAERWSLLLLALAFPYWRFAASNLAEGLYVGVLALICLATGRWLRSRPIVHALAAGALCAVLVLVKPNGLAVVAGLAGLVVLEAAASGGWRRLPLRGLLFAAVFFPLGNLIQIAAEAPPIHPLAFFVAENYAAIAGAATPPQGLKIGLLALGAMSSAVAVLAGVPILLALADLIKRWRARAGRFEAAPGDAVFLLLLLSLAATLAMVSLFALRVAWSPEQTGRLWGRYFEFFVPFLWLAAAPALAQPVGVRLRWACAAVMFVGLSGLLASLQAGIVLFPWDASILTAFFHPDPVRAPLGTVTPYRALATAATLAAALAVVLRVRPSQAGLALVLALGVLSTWLDHVWMGPVVAQRDAMARDLDAIRPALPAGQIVLLAVDANHGHLGFLRLRARPRVLLGPPARTPATDLAIAQAVVTTAAEAPPGGPWIATYRGAAFSLYRRGP